MRNQPKQPSPGSDAAVAAGCRCPLRDNAFGNGYMNGVKNEQGRRVFVINASCPLHGDPLVAALPGLEESDER